MTAGTEYAFHLLKWASLDLRVLAHCSMFKTRRFAEQLL